MPNRFLCRLAVTLLLAYPLTSQADETLLWFDSHGPTRQGFLAIDFLASASKEGLNPEDYGGNTLRQRVEAAAHADPQQWSALNAVLTASFERYLSDLRQGRVRPHQVEAHFGATGDPFNPQRLLHTALASQQLAETVQATSPSTPQYASLRLALARYRTLSHHPALQLPLPALPGRKLRPGEHWDGLPMLEAKLAALGDLTKQLSISSIYQGPLVEATKQFQLRHGLEPDGIIGKGTLEQLNTPISNRVRQIELSMERLRWTPLQISERMIVVNIPEFMLRSYEADGNATHLATSMRVIVGKAIKTKTPVFSEELRHIEFSPYWNIPSSIAIKETVPRLRHDSEYFERQGLEFVDSQNRTQNTLSAEALDQVEQGRWRLRQRPGDHNALGRIKFVFPNNKDIYLHHTPFVRLFERSRRDFSHGCIRIEDPVTLAKFALKNMPEWTESRIRKAMRGIAPSTVKLKHPIPVVIAYGTSLVRRDGLIYFFRDIYGHDTILEKALADRRRTLRLPFSGN